MKNQYFGDISDYAKYSLLRAFANDGISVGVNWYLTENDKSTDGKHIGYLNNEKQSCYDPELFYCLKDMVDAKDRDIKSFIKKDMIPDALYYHEMLHLSNVPSNERKDERDNWHINALSALEDAELVLLDPDNGIREDSMPGTRDSEKYALVSEAKDYYMRGQNIVYYCHKGRRTQSQWEKAKAMLCTYLPDDAEYIALTLHRGARPTFIFVIHPEDYEKYYYVLRKFMYGDWNKDFEVEQVDKNALPDGVRNVILTAEQHNWSFSSIEDWHQTKYTLFEDGTLQAVVFEGRSIRSKERHLSVKDLSFIKDNIRQFVEATPEVEACDGEAWQFEGPGYVFHMGYIYGTNLEKITEILIGER